MSCHLPALVSLSRPSFGDRERFSYKCVHCETLLLVFRIEKPW